MVSYWRNFIKDFGHLIGGFMIGFGLFPINLPLIGIGLLLVISSFYLQFND